MDILRRYFHAFASRKQRFAWGLSRNYESFLYVTLYPCLRIQCRKKNVAAHHFALSWLLPWNLQLWWHSEPTLDELIETNIVETRCKSVWTRFECIHILTSQIYDIVTAKTPLGILKRVASHGRLLVDVTNWRAIRVSEDTGTVSHRYIGTQNGHENSMLSMITIANMHGEEKWKRHHNPRDAAREGRGGRDCGMCGPLLFV